MKKFMSFILWIFAIIGLLSVIVMVLEPVYLKVLWNYLTWIKSSDRNSLNEIVNMNFWDINPNNIPLVEWEETINQWDIIKIDNSKLYKIEYISWDDEKWYIEFIWYNNKFKSTIFSPLKYSLFEQLKFDRIKCYYFWNTIYEQYDLDKNCEYIPTVWLIINWNWMWYPYTIIKNQRETQLKISKIH